MSITICSHESLQMEIWNSLSGPFFMTYEHWTWSVFCFQLAHVWTCLVLHISWVHVAAASCPHHLVLLQTSVGVKIQHITQLASALTLITIYSLSDCDNFWHWKSGCPSVSFMSKYFPNSGHNAATRRLQAALSSSRLGEKLQTFILTQAPPPRPSQRSWQAQHTWWVIIFHNQANCDCNTNHCFNKPPLTPLSSSHAHTQVFIPVLCTETVLSGVFKGFHFKCPLLVKFLNFDSDTKITSIYTKYSE